MAESRNSRSTPISPPSGPAPRLLQGPPSKSKFLAALRDDLNDSITDAEVIEMLAQHLITKPVFDSLFADYSFASHNPVSKAMQHTLDVLQEHRLEKEADTLEKFSENLVNCFQARRRNLFPLLISQAA